MDAMTRSERDAVKARAIGISQLRAMLGSDVVTAAAQLDAWAAVADAADAPWPVEGPL